MSDNEPIEAAGFKLFWEAEEEGIGEVGVVWMAPVDGGETLKEALASNLATCVAVEPEGLDELAVGLMQAKRWYGESDPDSPSPEQTALILGVACMVLHASLDRLGGDVHLLDGEGVALELTLDGKPLHPSQIAEVEQAVRAVRGER